MFNNLPLFQDAKKEIAFLKPAISEIGDIICKNNLENIVGVNLLHRHFSLNTNEILVKTINNNHAEIVPSDSNERCAPYLFKVEDNCFIPTEYISQNSDFFDDVESKQILLNNLDEVRDTITRLGVSEKLGIFLMHQSFDDHANMGWVEDSTNTRSLVITKKPIAEIITSEATETNWFFKKKETGLSDMTIGVMCGICCAIHCGIHCGWHG